MPLPVCLVLSVSREHRVAAGEEERRRLAASAMSSQIAFHKILAVLAQRLSLQETLLKSFTSQMKDLCSTARTMVLPGGHFGPGHSTMPGA